MGPFANCFLLIVHLCISPGADVQSLVAESNLFFGDKAEFTLRGELFPDRDVRVFVTRGGDWIRTLEEEKLPSICSSEDDCLHYYKHCKRRGIAWDCRYFFGSNLFVLYVTVPKRGDLKKVESLLSVVVGEKENLVPLVRFSIESKLSEPPYCNRRSESKSCRRL
jgi:hypothetical protein